MKTDGLPRLDQPLQLLDLPPDAVRSIDELCDYFEHQLYIEGRPRIEELLGGFKEPERSVLLRELLLLELEICLSRDTQPNQESYLKRFPGNERLVRDVFESIFPAPPSPAPPSAMESDASWPNIPNYRILRRLGVGGMGEVFEAIHVRLGMRVAMKVLKGDLACDLKAEARFEREMKLIGTLSHANIISARDAGKAGNRHYLVMEYVEGLDLDAIVKRLGTLPVADACEIVRSVALALQHADEHKLVHRDIKPKNVLLGRCPPNVNEVQIKVVDFGLASLCGYAALRDPNVHSARIGGTFAYMAPEQYWEQTSDVRSDIYSLGCTLYCLLLGRPPFSRPQYQDFHQVMDAHRSVSIASFRKLRPDVAESLEKIVLAMMAKVPQNRIQTPVELAEALAPFTAGRDLQGLLERAAPLLPAIEAGQVVRAEPRPQPAPVAPAAPPARKKIAVKSRLTEPEPDETLPGEFPAPRPDPAAPGPDVAPFSPVASRELPGGPPGHPAPTGAMVWSRRQVSGALIGIAAIVVLLGAGWWGRHAFRGSQTDLLALVDLQQLPMNGDWTFDGRILTSPEDDYALLQLPWSSSASTTDSPPEQYQLQIEADHVSGVRSFAVGLVWQGRQVPVVLDAWVIADPAKADSQSYDAASIPPAFDFRGGPPRTYTCIVRREGLLAAYENQVLFLGLAGQKSPSVDAKWLAADLSRTALFLGTRHGVYRFTKIVLTPLDR